jgi:hypothetical protein
MIVPYILLVILLGWSLYDGDLYPREGGFIIAIMGVTHLVFLLLKLSFAWYVVTTVLVDIYLIVKVFGGAVQIR